METKDQYFQRMRDMKAPTCPHCNSEMSIWEVPPISFSDGLGWCAPYLFVCFNDECALYKNGWDQMAEEYGQTASYRCFRYLDSNECECMPVFSPMGAKGQIIDDQTLLQEEMLKESMKRGFAILADCFVNTDEITVTRLLMDPAEPPRVRLKAAEMLGDIGSAEAIETIQDVQFEGPAIQKQVDEAVKKLHERHFTRACPGCRRTIKKRASVCKYCGQDVSGR